MERRKQLASIVFLAWMVVLSPTIYAGNLEPSAAPGPTMKTLDEVEPRISITQDDIPLAITESGSYYLMGDVNAVGTAITVEVNDVTIDLMGYSLIGPGSGTSNGIHIFGRSNVEIRNGTVRNFGRDGIMQANLAGKEHRVISVRAFSNGENGISLVGSGHLVKDCTAADNSNDGIYADSGSTVTGNMAYNNNVGVVAKEGCTVSGNTAYRNEIVGISAGSGCTVIGNTVYNNEWWGIGTSSGSTVIGNTAYNNGVDGIGAGEGSTVSGNTAYNNRGCGICAGDGSTVTGNTVRLNNQDESPLNSGIKCWRDCLIKGNTANWNKRNNIYVINSGNTIEENSVTGSTGNGIYVTDSNNIIIKNTARGNSTNYNIAAGNAYGQIMNVAGGGSFSNTDPTANFEF